MRKGKGMKKRIISKILTLLVAFSMVFTLLPVNNKNSTCWGQQSKYWRLYLSWNLSR